MKRIPKIIGYFVTKSKNMIWYAKSASCYLITSVYLLWALHCLCQLATKLPLDIHQ